MRTCEHLVRLGRFTPTNPSDLLAKSYYELLHHKKAILGKNLYEYRIIFKQIRLFCLLSIHSYDILMEIYVSHVPMHTITL